MKTNLAGVKFAASTLAQTRYGDGPEGAHWQATDDGSFVSAWMRRGR